MTRARHAHVHVHRWDARTHALGRESEACVRRLPPAVVSQAVRCALLAVMTWVATAVTRERVCRFVMRHTVEENVLALSSSRASAMDMGHGSSAARPVSCCPTCPSVPRRSPQTAAAWWQAGALVLNARVPCALLLPACVRSCVQGGPSKEAATLTVADVALLLQTPWAAADRAVPAELRRPPPGPPPPGRDAPAEAPAAAADGPAEDASPAAGAGAGPSGEAGGAGAQPPQRRPNEAALAAARAAEARLRLAAPAGAAGPAGAEGAG